MTIGPRRIKEKKSKLKSFPGRFVGLVEYLESQSWNKNNSGFVKLTKLLWSSKVSFEIYVISVETKLHSATLTL